MIKLYEQAAKLKEKKNRCLLVSIVFYIEFFWAWDAARDM